MERKTGGCDHRPEPCCALEDPHHFPSKPLSPLLSCDRTVGKVSWHTRVLWSLRDIATEGFFRKGVWGAEDGGSYGVGDQSRT